MQRDVPARVVDFGHSQFRIRVERIGAGEALLQIGHAIAVGVAIRSERLGMEN